MKKIALFLSLLLLALSIAVILLPGTTTATAIVGRHCVMRSLLVLDADQVADFAVRIKAADADVAAAVVVAAITIDRGQTVGDVNSKARYQTPMWGLICLMGTIGFIVNILFWVLAIVFLVLTIIGVFIIMTAAGDANKVKKGKNYIVYAIVGLVASLFVRAVPAMIRFMVGM
jgi:hypothetical protein